MYELAVGAESKNYQAVALTLRAWVYANLTDCFGDVPMTEACRGDEGILTPANFLHFLTSPSYNKSVEDKLSDSSKSEFAVSRSLNTCS